MRILRVAQKVYPDVPGGGTYHVHALSRDQAAMGHDVTVLTVRRDGRPRREERDGYTVLRRDPTASVLGNELSAGLAKELWDVDGFEVVHAHSHLYFSTNVAALRRRFDDTPLAITNHGLRSQAAPGRLFEWYLHSVGRRTLDAADVVFTYSDAERRELRKLGVRTDVAVVPNGIDVERFTPGGPERARVDVERFTPGGSERVGVGVDRFTPEGSERTGVGDGPSVLFSGRLVDGKRPADAIDAFAELVGTYPEATLYFAGDGPRKVDLERRAEAAGITDQVTFLGHLDYDAMPALYRSVDLLVLPSETEGLPRTVLEALASGTPVVTSDLPQLASLTERGGVAVPVGDVDALATGVQALLSDPDRRARLGDAGRQYVADHHDWAETVRSTTDRLAGLGE